MRASYVKYMLQFKRPSGTSRGILTEKETWFLVLEDKNRIGVGECSLLRGLSIDDVSDYEYMLNWVCENIDKGAAFLKDYLVMYPSIRFGIEQAFLSLKARHNFKLFPSDFTNKEAPIPINGLIWMGDEIFMQEQIAEKLAQGFNCLKIKIGAINFKKELTILEGIRKKYSKEQIELRVDANGAFSPESAIEKLHRLAEFDIHSIEQPIAPKQWEVMEQLCVNSPLAIALDEELIGVHNVTKKEELLLTLRPAYLILKPSLLGGFSACEEWIELAEKHNVGWWVTSALESNIGLNAIAQWTYTLKNKMPQGLGTGSLFTNNIGSPLMVSNGKLVYRKTLYWQTDLIEKLCI